MRSALQTCSSISSWRSRSAVDAQSIEPPKTDVSGAPAGTTIPTAEADDGRVSYTIHFRPHLQLLARGNDPLRMFGELRQLGDLSLQADVTAMPALAGF